MLMARCWSVSLCTVVCVVLWSSIHVALASLSSSSLSPGSGSDETPSFTCDQVREVFEGQLGAPDALHLRPVPENHTSLCSHGAHSPHSTCCSEDTEGKFASLVEKRLKEKVKARNHPLKKHITGVLARFQDRLSLLVGDARNRTSVFLSRLHKIPWVKHEEIVRDFFSAILLSVQTGDAGMGVEQAVGDLFTRLFPPVFNYVLTVQGQEEKQPITKDYHDCLQRYADQIQPFGNQPERILKHLRRSVMHSIVFQDTLKVFTDALSSTEAVAMDPSCRHALIRLQVCPGCRGISLREAMVKPCRGMCLNVLRGCLAKTSEISSSWDDLIVSFENLQVGLMGRHDLQKMLIYMDMNVSEAIMMAMNDSPRIYDEVRVKCQSLARQMPAVPHRPTLPLIPESLSSEDIPPRNTHLLHTFHQEVRTLVRHLEDAKGLFNRLPDALCQDEHIFSQDMQSATCWNGSTVGRYMEEVPEANFLSQVQHNKEVKVTLMDPDFKFLVVKESLAHMRQNLSLLLNKEIMLGDGPNTLYKKVSVDGQESSGYGYRGGIVDDEDLLPGASGSGSGSGDSGPEDGGNEIPTKIDVQPKPGRTEPPKDGGSGQGEATISFLLLSLCAFIHRLL